MKFCHNCGAQLEDGAKFCYKCGQKQEEAQNVTPTITKPVNETVHTTIDTEKIMNSASNAMNTAKDAVVDFAKNINFGQFMEALKELMLTGKSSGVISYEVFFVLALDIILMVSSIGFINNGFFSIVGSFGKSSGNLFENLKYSLIILGLVYLFKYLIDRFLNKQIINFMNHFTIYVNMLFRKLVILFVVSLICSLTIVTALFALILFIVIMLSTIKIDSNNTSIFSEIISLLVKTVLIIALFFIIMETTNQTNFSNAYFSASSSDILGSLF